MLPGFFVSGAGRCRRAGAAVTSWCRSGMCARVSFNNGKVMGLSRSVMVVVLLLIAAASPAPAAAPRLKVSENRRFLVKEDGSPFFYLGDTAWELFHRLDREGAEQ